MIYIKVDDALYPAVINGKMVDYEWDNRSSKSITLEMTHDEVIALLPDNIAWSIVQETEEPAYNADGSPKLDSNGKQVMKTVTAEWDNSEYSMSGDVIDHRNGKVTIKMGKSTDLEDAYEMLIGG